MMGWFSNFYSSPLFNHIEQEEHKISACVRLGNPDLDFKNRIRILQSNAKTENGFHVREIRLQGGFQLRSPNPDFMDFLFTVRLVSLKKDLQNCCREQRSSFC